LRRAAHSHLKLDAADKQIRAQLNSDSTPRIADKKNIAAAVLTQLNAEEDDDQ